MAWIIFGIIFVGCFTLSALGLYYAIDEKLKKPCIYFSVAILTFIGLSALSFYKWERAIEDYAIRADINGEVVTTEVFKNNELVKIRHHVDTKLKNTPYYYDTHDVDNDIDFD